MRCIQWLWILFLLCHTACNGCRSYEIPHEEDQWGAAIAIKPTSGGGVTFLGSINGLPVLNLRGTISKNIPGVDTAYLCALFVPDGEAPDAGAKAIQGHTIKADSHGTSSSTFALGKLHKLPDGSFVQYARPLGPDEAGDVDFSVASYDSDDSLILGTKYNIYLGIKVGPHFFYTAGAHADHTLSNNALALTQVTMASAHCAHGRDTNGKILPQLSAEASVTNLPGGATTGAGFLFIKQGANLTPSGVLSKQFAPGSTPLPTTSNTLTAHPDSKVVCCAAGTAANPFSITDVADTNSVLEKGATYDVYGYVGYSNDYFVSQNSCAITLPEVEIEVAMGLVGDPALIATKNSSDTAYNVSEFELEVRGRIEKIDNAKDPVAGFVFVVANPVQDKTTICQAITGAISNASLQGNVIDVNNNKEHVVCIAATTDVGTVREITHTCNLQNGTDSRLDLTKDYNVYFWVKDAKGDGELFLSDGSALLQVFYVAGGGITSVSESHSGNELTIRPDVDISTSPSGDVRDAKMAVFFLKNNAPTKTDLEALRTCYVTSSSSSSSPTLQPKWNSASSTLSFGQNDKFYALPDASSGEKSIEATNGIHLEAATQYQLSLVVLRERVLYCIPYAHLYTTPVCVHSTQPNPISNISGRRQVELNFTTHRAYLLNANQGRDWLDPALNVQTIKEAIDAYCSPDKQGDNYRAFGINP